MGEVTSLRKAQPPESFEPSNLWIFASLIRKVLKSWSPDQNISVLSGNLAGEGVTSNPPNNSLSSLVLKILPGQPVDSGLDENKTELGIPVLPVLLQMLADGHGLLDEEVQILWNIGSQTLWLQDTQNLVASNKTHLNMNKEIWTGNLI